MMRGKQIAALLAVVCLLCGCGKHSESDEFRKSTTETAETTAAEQTEAETTAVTTTAEPQKNADLDGSLSAYLWEDYDLAFKYPSAYTVAPEESTNDGVLVLSAETGDTADGLLKMLVSKGSYTEDTFAGLERTDVLNMFGLDGSLLVTSKVSDTKLRHLSGVNAEAKKFTTKCEYDGTEAELTVLLVNCFDTDCFYALEYICTDDAYADFCTNLEEYFYLGNCQVRGDVVKQYLKADRTEPQQVDMGYGCSITLSADWREMTDAEDEDDDSLQYVTAQGDYLIFSADESMSEEAFQSLMDTQQVGSGSGGLTITEKEAHTVNGCSAYLVHATRPSWGLSDAETVPVVTWYINTDNSFLMISMIDISGTQTDFILHPETFLEF